MSLRKVLLCTLLCCSIHGVYGHFMWRRLFSGPGTTTYNLTRLPRRNATIIDLPVLDTILSFDCRMSMTHGIFDAWQCTGPRNTYASIALAPSKMTAVVRDGYGEKVRIDRVSNTSHTYVSQTPTLYAATLHSMSRNVTTDLERDIRIRGYNANLNTIHARRLSSESVHEPLVLRKVGILFVVDSRFEMFDDPSLQEELPKTDQQDVLEVDTGETDGLLDALPSPSPQPILSDLFDNSPHPLEWNGLRETDARLSNRSDYVLNHTSFYIFSMVANLNDILMAELALQVVPTFVTLRPNQKIWGFEKSGIFDREELQELRQHPDIDLIAGVGMQKDVPYRSEVHLANQTSVTYSWFKVTEIMKYRKTPTWMTNPSFVADVLLLNQFDMLHSLVQSVGYTLRMENTANVGQEPFQGRTVMSRGSANPYLQSVRVGSVGKSANMFSYRFHVSSIESYMRYMSHHLKPTTVPPTTMASSFTVVNARHFQDGVARIPAGSRFELDAILSCDHCPEATFTWDPVEENNTYRYNDGAALDGNESANISPHPYPPRDYRGVVFRAGYPLPVPTRRIAPCALKEADIELSSSQYNMWSERKELLFRRHQSDPAWTFRDNRAFEHALYARGNFVPPYARTYGFKVVVREAPDFAHSGHPYGATAIYGPFVVNATGGEPFRITSAHWEDAGSRVAVAWRTGGSEEYCTHVDVSIVSETCDTVLHTLGSVSNNGSALIDVTSTWNVESTWLHVKCSTGIFFDTARLTQQSSTVVTRSALKTAFRDAGCCAALSADESSLAEMSIDGLKIPCTDAKRQYLNTCGNGSITFDTCPTCIEATSAPCEDQTIATRSCRTMILHAASQDGLDICDNMLDNALMLYGPRADEGIDPTVNASHLPLPNARTIDLFEAAGKRVRDACCASCAYISEHLHWTQHVRSLAPPPPPPSSPPDYLSDYAQRYAIVGDALTFSTIYDENAPAINWDDVTEIDRILRHNFDLRTVVLESEGGDLYAGLELGRMLLNFAMNTRVDVFCESACAYMFLGGTERILGRGGRLGFHRSWWAAENMRTYFRKERESNGWETRFDFASWVVEDTTNDVYLIQTYMLDRGVDPYFAVRSQQAEASDMWYPYPHELLQWNYVTALQIRQ